MKPKLLSPALQAPANCPHLPLYPPLPSCSLRHHFLRHHCEVKPLAIPSAETHPYGVVSPPSPAQPSSLEAFSAVCTEVMASQNLHQGSLLYLIILSWGVSPLCIQEVSGSLWGCRRDAPGPEFNFWGSTPNRTPSPTHTLVGVTTGDGDVFSFFPPFRQQLARASLPFREVVF